MNYRRAVSVLLAVSAAMMLATGSLGFTSVTAERSVSVNVVDSENAYVGVQACEKSNGNGTPVRVWVTNRYSEPFTVTNVAGDTGNSLSSGQQDELLGVGDEKTFESLRVVDEVTVHVTGGLDATVTAPVQRKGNCSIPSGNSSG